MGRPYTSEQAVLSEIIIRTSQYMRRGYTIEELEKKKSESEGRFLDDPKTEWYIRKEAYARAIEALKKQKKGAEHNAEAETDGQ